jgi:hypothetical protein
VILYTTLPDARIELLARVAGADGIVDKRRHRPSCSRRSGSSRAGRRRCRRLTRGQLDTAAHRVEADDLGALAMLVDRTPAADVAATLHMDRRRVAKRTERVLGRLRRDPAPRAAV